MTIGVEGFVILSAVLFSLGLYGAISKRGAVTVLMSLELMSIAINVNLLGLSRFVTPEQSTGQYFTLFAIVVSAAEIGLGLALVLALYRARHTAELDELDRLKG